MFDPRVLLDGVDDLDHLEDALDRFTCDGVRSVRNAVEEAVDVAVHGTTGARAADGRAVEPRTGDSRTERRVDGAARGVVGDGTHRRRYPE
jgi:hypothetical protein